MIVSRVTSNSAMVAGLFVPKPNYLTSSEWRDFWNGPDGVGRGHKALVNFDAFRAMVFGAVIPKPSAVTQAEWSEFWQARSDRPPIELTNQRADDAYLRQYARTPGKPKK